MAAFARASSRTGRCQIELIRVALVPVWLPLYGQGGNDRDEIITARPVP